MVQVARWSERATDDREVAGSNGESHSPLGIAIVGRNLWICAVRAYNAYTANRLTSPNSVTLSK